MNRIIKNAFIGLLLVCFLISAPALGQTGGDYNLSWSTIDGGGATSTGGPYMLSGTIAQPDAGWMAAGDYELLGGFWPGGPLCIVDFKHFTRFAEHWLETSCDAGNNWCGGADLDQLGDVDLADFGLFVEEWLYYCPYKWPLK